MNPYLLIIGLVALALGGVMGFFIKNYLIARETDVKQSKANQILNDAQRKSTEVIKKAQDQAIQIVQTSEKEAQSRRTEITRIEERLQSRGDHGMPVPRTDTNHAHGKVNEYVSVRVAD